MSKALQCIVLTINICFLIIIKILTDHYSNDKKTQLTRNSNKNFIKKSNRFNSSQCILRHYSGSPTSSLTFNIKTPIVNTKNSNKKPRQKDYDKFFNRSLADFDPRSFEFTDYEAEISTGYEKSTPTVKIPLNNCFDDNLCRKEQVTLDFKILQAPTSFTRTLIFAMRRKSGILTISSV